MALNISVEMLARIREHAVQSYPDECCGALIGRADNGVKWIKQIERLRNAEPDAPQRRFAIEPRELMLLDRSAAAEGLSVVGFYHSHPDSPARPSQTDLDSAWPVYSYVIVAVQAGHAVDARSFELNDDVAPPKFAEETIDIAI